MLLLSIITINYNNASGLHKTIESVISQSFKDFEYIIIDGGSTDRSKEIIEFYTADLTYWISEKDKGIYNAMNKGIAKSTGQYLLFLNSGDWLYNTDTFKSILSYLHNDDIIYGNIINVSNAGKEWLQTPPSQLSLYDLGYCKNSLPHQAMFIKRKLFERHGGYDESLKMVSDWAFYLTAIFKHNCTYKKIEQIIAYYAFSGFSADEKNEPLQKAERILVIDKYFNNYKSLFKEIENLKIRTWRFDHSRIIKTLKNIGLLKFDIRP